MLVRQHESLVEELRVQLSFDGPITSSGAVLTLPAATTDLRDWVADRRKFLAVQYEDWMQVVRDFRDSVSATGPNLSRLVAASTAQIRSLLNVLFSSTTAADGAASRAIDATVRADVLKKLEQLDTELATEGAIVAAWRDLVKGADQRTRSVEEISFRRDTLFAVAQRRNLDVVGSFGTFNQVSSVLADVADAVRAELAEEAGVTYARPMPPSRGPSGVPTWRRIELCERVLARPPFRGDCIVWLRLEPTFLPEHDVTHGQVTFYNASYISGFVRQPDGADEFFDVVPTEILLPVPPDRAPILEDGEVEWEDNWNMTYARVTLPGTETHTAYAKAVALVEALKSVNHAESEAWTLLPGHLLYVDGERRSLLSWGPKEHAPGRTYYAQNDRLHRDIRRMARANQTLDARSIHDLQDAMAMSAALKVADKESPQAVVMASVRAIEHMNAWTTGGVKDWAEYASDYFKKAQARVKAVGLISHFTRTAIHQRPDRRPGAPRGPEQALFEIEQRLRRTVGAHEYFDVRASVDEVTALRAIYTDHFLSRGLGEIETAVATPAALYGLLDEQCRRFERHLARLKRLRNSAIHGGPVSDTACQSVAVFAFNLGHQCLNEAMKALLAGIEIPTHMSDFRADHIDRFKRVKQTGDIDALFVEVHIEDDD
ncbi:hypothetical protein NIIDNTM18_14940 [Mycolicibacterium litorale]|uniref:Uncharacterized protein n=1 Tax=Mycolicibacterium litorale TaxID=758802 RepID=A0A6S6P2J2_9MYCO|nr:hypothetical protein [Mycolicibacterium litorale]BCI52216.1 hypothetical protein NIIDNTM18_14940 [Mycolicibacterium litorale]